MKKPTKKNLKKMIIDDNLSIELALNKLYTQRVAS